MTKTLLEKDGYGLNVGEEVKKKYFLEELRNLCDSYAVNLSHHPFDNSGLYIVNKGNSFVNAKPIDVKDC